MIRVLQGFVANQYGGVSKYIYNNYLYINHKKIQYDFLYIGEIPDFATECTKKGACFYRIDRMRNIIRYVIGLWNVIKNNDYYAVYFNLSFCSIIPVLVAKCAGAKRIFLHAHAADIEANSKMKRFLLKIYHNISIKLINFINIDKFIACSDMAGTFCFGKDVIRKHNYSVLKNSINVNLYSYSSDISKKYRKTLNIDEETFVVGHVGRFSYAKNHNFLIDIFFEIQKIRCHTKLILVGKGELEYEIRSKIQALNIESKVIFMNERDDIHILMQVMDCLVLPSRFEGFGMVGLEAQAAGLPCFISDKCPEELKLTDLLHFISLKDSPKKWADIIVENTNVRRRNMSNQIVCAGYDIGTQIKSIENLYT